MKYINWNQYILIVYFNDWRVIALKLYSMNITVHAEVMRANARTLYECTVKPVYKDTEWDTYRPSGAHLGGQGPPRWAPEGRIC